MNETFLDYKNNSYIYNWPAIEQNVPRMNRASQRIQELVQSQNGNQRQVAIRSGIEPRTFNNYFKGREPPADAIQKIADAFGLDLAWFYSSDPLPESVSDRVSSPAQPPYRAQTDEHVEIQCYANRMGAGVPAIEDKDIILEGLRFRKDWLRKMTSAPFDKLKTLYISGDSMEPKVCDGDLILVDCSDIKPKKKEIYALRYDGGVMAKYVTADHLRKLYILSSENPLYKPFEAQEDEVEIIGRLLWRAGKI